MHFDKTITRTLTEKEFSLSIVVSGKIFPQQFSSKFFCDKQEPLVLFNFDIENMIKDVLFQTFSEIPSFEVFEIFMICNISENLMYLIVSALEKQPQTMQCSRMKENNSNLNEKSFDDERNK